jgi:broad specificity phosphatase PhoE
MRIVLLRHGKPDVPKLGKLRASEIYQWIESYNSAGLNIEHRPSREAIEIANNCNTIVCSDLPRSIESARALGVREVNHIESMFREMGLPYASFPSPKLSPNIWAALFRVLWFFGYSSNGESLREAKLRASNGASMLKEIAANTGSVLLVGHGFVNRFIAKELLSNGWQGPASPGKKYWEFGIYEYAT